MFQGPRVHLPGMKEAEQYDDEDLAALADGSITELHLENQRITHVPPAPRVRTLTIKSCGALTSLAGIEAMSGLAELTLEKLTFPADELARIAELPELVSLRLDGVNIAALPEGFARCPSLAELSLQIEGLDLEATATVLASIPTLKRLRVWMYRRDWGAVGMLRQLRELILFGAGAMPAGVYELVDLEGLVSFGEVERIDPAIARLAKLRALEVRHTKVRAFPPLPPSLRDLKISDATTELPNAEQLHLDHFEGPQAIASRIRMRPPEAPHGDHVTISDPNRVPSSFGNPATLTVDLMTFDGDLPQLAELTRVSRVDLHVVRLREAVRYLAKSPSPYLKRLKIWGRRKLPDEIGELVTLEELALDERGPWEEDYPKRPYLRDLPAAVAKLARLRKLEIECSRFAKLPSAILDLPIEDLFHRGSFLRSLEGIERLAALRKLDLLSNNPGVVDLRACSRLEWLRLSETRIERVVVAGLANLREVRLRELDVIGVEPLFDDLASTSIARLDLAGSSIRTLPPTIGALAKLEHLEIHNTKIEKFPYEIAGCSALRWIAVTTEAVPALEAILPMDAWEKQDLGGTHVYTRSST